MPIWGYGYCAHLADLLYISMSDWWKFAVRFAISGIVQNHLNIADIADIEFIDSIL